MDLYQLTTAKWIAATVNGPSVVLFEHVVEDILLKCRAESLNGECVFLLMNSLISKLAVLSDGDDDFDRAFHALEYISKAADQSLLDRLVQDHATRLQIGDDLSSRRSAILLRLLTVGDNPIQVHLILGSPETWINSRESLNTFVSGCALNDENLAPVNSSGDAQAIIQKSDFERYLSLCRNLVALRDCPQYAHISSSMTADNERLWLLEELCYAVGICVYRDALFNDESVRRLGSCLSKLFKELLTEHLTQALQSKLKFLGKTDLSSTAYFVMLMLSGLEMNDIGSLDAAELKCAFARRSQERSLSIIEQITDPGSRLSALKWSIPDLDKCTVDDLINFASSQIKQLKDEVSATQKAMILGIRTELAVKAFSIDQFETLLSEEFNCSIGSDGSSMVDIYYAARMYKSLASNEAVRKTSPFISNRHDAIGQMLLQAFMRQSYGEFNEPREMTIY